jgi:hypothetical protein
MSVVIRLESDWGLPPFYVDAGGGSFEGCSAGRLATMFGLPDHVMRALEKWDQLYQAVLDWDDPRGSDWASPADEQRYLECGRAAARLLRQHLADDVRIEYAGAASIPTEYY